MAVIYLPATNRIAIRIAATLGWLLLAVAAHSQSNSKIFDLAREGKAAALDSLLRASPEEAQLRDANGNSALILAAYHGQTDAVAILAPLDDVNYVCSYGTALMGASVKGHTEIARLLLDHQANPNLGDFDGNTPLIYATMFEHTAMAKLLLANDANPLAKNKKGFSAVDYAERQRNTTLSILFDTHLITRNE